LAFSLAFAPAFAEAANFNDVLPGARPMGMGYAYTADSSDLYGMFFNPAGLAGAPFTQATASVGRLISPVGMLSMVTAAYSRPLPILPGATVGMGFLDIKQRLDPGRFNGGEKSELLFHFSDTVNLQKYYIPKPVRLGGNFKVVVVNPAAAKNKAAPGLDLGAQIEPGWNTTLGISVTDLTASLPVQNPSLNVGASYRWRSRVNLATDIRIRPGLTQVFPGLEADFYQRLLKLRLGKGLSLNGEDAIAIGAGINFSPLILDFAMTIPSNGVNRNGGGFQCSTTWKFGAPAFYGRFVGQAARRAEQLRSEIGELDRESRDMRSRRDAAEADKTSLEGQVQAEEERLRELQQQSRDLEYELQRRRYDRDHPGPADPLSPAPGSSGSGLPAGIDSETTGSGRPAGGDAGEVESSAPPQAAAPATKRAPRRSRSGFPKRHRVRPGDTLRKLAETYYGNAALWEAIYEANPDRIERGLPIEGKTLLIPSPERR